MSLFLNCVKLSEWAIAKEADMLDHHAPNLKLNTFWF